MPLNNLTTLLKDANLIRYADRDGFNTAERVGKMLVDLINETNTSIELETSTREKAYESLRTAIENIEYADLTSGGTIDGDLYVNGNTRIAESLLVQGTASFSKSVTVHEGLWVHGGSYLYDGLQVGGNTLFFNTVTIDEDLSVGGNITANGNLTVLGEQFSARNVLVNGDAKVLGTLMCVSSFNSNSIETVKAFDAFRVGSSTDPASGWGTYIWSYGNGRGFIQQGSGVSGNTSTKFTLTLQPFGGNVGIGWGNLANPQYLLDVNGTIRSTGTILANRGLSVGNDSGAYGEVRIYDYLGDLLFYANPAPGYVQIRGQFLDVSPIARFAEGINVTGSTTTDSLTVNGNASVTGTLTIGEVSLTSEKYTLGEESALIVGGDGIVVSSISVASQILADNAIMSVADITTDALTVNGDASVTGNVTVGTRFSIDSQTGDFSGRIYTGSVESKEFIQYEGIFVVTTPEPMELDTDVNIYGLLNVHSPATFGKVTATNVTAQNFSTPDDGTLNVGTALKAVGDDGVTMQNVYVYNGLRVETWAQFKEYVTFNSTLTANGTSSFKKSALFYDTAIFSKDILIEPVLQTDGSYKHGRILMIEGGTAFSIPVLGFSNPDGAYPYLEIGSSADLDYYEGVTIYGRENSISGNLSFGSDETVSILSDGFIGVASWSSNQNGLMNIGDYLTVEHGVVAIAGDLTRLDSNEIIVSGSMFLNQHLQTYSTVNLSEILYIDNTDIAKVSIAGSLLDINTTEVTIKSTTTITGDVTVKGNTEITERLSAGYIDCYDKISMDGKLYVGDIATFYDDAHFSGSTAFSGIMSAESDIWARGDIKLLSHSFISDGVHTALTASWAANGTEICVAGLHDNDSKIILGIGSQSYASSSAPDSIVLVTSYEEGSIELIGNVYVPQTFRLGGATFTYDATNDRVTCDKDIVTVAPSAA